MAVGLEGVFRMQTQLASPSVTGGARCVSTSFFSYNDNYVKRSVHSKVFTFPWECSDHPA